MLLDKYHVHFEHFTDAETECIMHHADPHPKQQLRIQAFRELTETNELTDADGLWLKSVTVKMKPLEFAKPGKKPRVIGDYGVNASLLGFRVTNFLKQAMSDEVIEINGGHMAFCKSPDPHQLRMHFQKLFNPPGRFYFVYFSDDSCLALRNPCTGKVDWFNLDISSCDASHGPRMFWAFLKLFPKGAARDAAKRLVRQCCLPIKVYSCDDPKVFVRLRASRPMLYSGSTITTAINNLACLLIMLAISQIEYTGLLNANGEAIQLVEAAASVGYIVTGCEPLSCFEDVQFLKNSPVWDLTVDDWMPMLNFGVLVRASGTCHGDLPGSGPLTQRFKVFQSQLVQGCYPYLDFHLVNLMKSTAGNTSVATPLLMLDDGEPVPFDRNNRVLRDIVERQLAYKVDFEAAPLRVRVDPLSFCRRYRLTGPEYVELLDLFGSASVGDFVNTSGLTKILAKDYGLACVEQTSYQYINLSYSSPSSEPLA